MKRYMVFAVLLLILLALVAAPGAHADPCPSPPCDTTTSAPDPIRE